MKKRCAKHTHKKIINVRNSGDLASYFARNNANTITLDKGGRFGMLESHSLNNIRF